MRIGKNRCETSPNGLPTSHSQAGYQIWRAHLANLCDFVGRYLNAAGRFLICLNSIATGERGSLFFQPAPPEFL
jgi:hypothetical protein